MSETQCVIFDCDGTLIDSEKLCCQALSETFHHFGAGLSTQDALAHFEGGKLADILATTNERLGCRISIDQLEPFYRERLDELFERHLKPSAGATELLKQLEAKGIEYCVASNGPKSKIRRSLELTGLYPHFENKIFSAFDTNSWKPEPDLILYTAMTMGFRLENCVYVDDTVKGLEAGVRAGIKTVHYLGVNNRVHEHALPKIHDLRELTTLM